MQKENVAAMWAGKIPKPEDRLKSGIKVDRSKFKSIKDYKVSLNKKVDYDALTTQKEGHWQDKNAKQKETLKKHDKRMIDSARASMVAAKKPKQDVRKYINGKPEGFTTEDVRYNPTPGGHEWGTPQGTAYYKSLTPGEGKKSLPLKPLPIKARKPENEKQTWRPKKSVYKSVLEACHVEDFNMRYADPANFVGFDHISDKQADHSKHRYPINNELETFDTGDDDHWLTGKDGEWYIEDNDVTDLEKEAESFTFDKAVDLGLYDDDELEDEDYDGDPLNDIDITEALSVQGRLKRRFNARRNKQKLRVARNIALRRGSTPDRLKKRATRGARLMVYKRLLRGRDRSALPPAEKARLERMIKKFAPLVSRISIKLLPQMRKNEIKRLTGRGKKRPGHSKKYKAAKPVRSASSQKAKRYKIKSGGKYKAPKAKKFKSAHASGGPTLKKASKAYKAFSYSVG